MRINAFILKLFPASSGRRTVLVNALKRVGVPIGQPDLNYHHWFEQLERSKQSNLDSLKRRPLISIVVPSYNTPEYEFMEMVYSVVNQSYENWELIIVNVSGKKDKFQYINKASDIDERIKVITTDNVDIPTNTNVGIKNAKGEYVGLLDHDDTLTFFALYEMVKAINNCPEVGLIYSDEDKVDASKRFYSDPFFKPDLSLELLENVNYITHFTVIKRSLVEKVGYMDPQCNGSQDYDLFLKIVDLGVNVAHVPLVLYHWRKTKNSTASNIKNKQYIYSSGKRAIEQHVSRIGLKGEAHVLENLPGFYKIIYKNNDQITIVFLRRGSVVQQKLYILQWLKNNCQNKRINKILVSSKLSLGDGVDPRIGSFRNNHDLLATLNQTDGVSIFLNGFYELDQNDKDWPDELVSNLEKKEVFSISPIITDKNKVILGGGYYKSANESQLKTVLNGVKLGVDTPIGYSGFIRNVVAPNTCFFAIKNSNIGSSINSLLDPIEHSKVAAKNKIPSILWTHISVTDLGHDINFSSEYPALEFGKSTYKLAQLPEIEEVAGE